MPAYEYRCRDCGHDFEIQQAFTDEALTVCPECSGSLRKVFGAVGISFKGSGFYKTDSRGGTKKSSSTSGDGGSGSSESGGSGESSSSKDTAAVGSGSSDAASGGSGSSPTPTPGGSTTTPGGSTASTSS